MRLRRDRGGTAARSRDGRTGHRANEQKFRFGARASSGGEGATQRIGVV
jgi:hypothetical protein